MHIISFYEEFKWWLEFIVTVLTSVFTLFIAVFLGIKQIREQVKANEIALQGNQINDLKNLKNFYKEKFEKEEELVNHEPKTRIHNWDGEEKNKAQIPQENESKNRQNHSKQNIKKCYKSNKRNV